MRITLAVFLLLVPLQVLGGGPGDSEEDFRVPETPPRAQGKGDFRKRGRSASPSDLPEESPRSRQQARTEGDALFIPETPPDRIRRSNQDIDPQIGAELQKILEVMSSCIAALKYLLERTPPK